jgi:predicted CoA-binding protein
VSGRRINDDASVAELLRSTRNIAIVGVSPRPDRASFDVARYLQRAAPEYTLTFVNPTVPNVLGSPCFDSLAQLEPVELVGVFRRLEAIPQVAADAIAANAAVLWTQLGLFDAEAEQMSIAAGLDVVMDRCIKTEHARLIRRSGSV